MATKTTSPKKTTKKSIQTKAARGAQASTEQVFDNLNRWNKILAAIFALQALLIVVLAGSHSRPVTANYLTPDPLTSSTGQQVWAAATRTLFNVNVMWLLVLFLVIGALTSLMNARWYRATYETDLANRVNTLRWISYALGCGVMMVTLGLLVGVYDIASLLMIFVLTEIASLSGLLLETTRPKNWVHYMIAGKGLVLPWLVLAIYLLSAGIFGDANLPAYVYWAFGTMAVLCGATLANAHKLAQKSGRWADYMYGEKMYLLLGLVAKTALAWIIFFGALR